MKLKYMIRGVGIGVILTAIAFFFLIGKNEAKLTEAEIIEEARKLGMMTKEDVNQMNLEQMKSEAIKEETLEERKTEEKSVVNESIKTDLSKEGIKEEEKKTDTDKGKKPSNNRGREEEIAKSPEKDKAEDQRDQATDKRDKTEGKENKTTGKDTEAKGKEAKTPTQENDSSKKDEAVTENKEGKKPKAYYYTVKPGSSAVQLCKDLQAMGLIQDAKDFNQYLADNQYARKIRAGNFTFYDDETYYSIANKLISRELNP